MQNKITILGEDFFYKKCWGVNEYYDYDWTIFYKNVITKVRKKYFIFGPSITIQQPIELFRVDFWITNPNITKSKLKSILEEKVREYRGLKNRKTEIENGELI